MLGRRWWVALSRVGYSSLAVRFGGLTPPPLDFQLLSPAESPFGQLPHNTGVGNHSQPFDV